MSSLPYSITQEKKKTFKNMVTDTLYSLTLDSTLHNRSLGDVMTDLHSIFDDALTTALDSVRDDAKVRVIIDSPELTSQIVVPLASVNEMSASRVIEVLDACFQSNKGLKTHDLTSIQIGVYEPPYGGASTAKIYRVSGLYDCRRSKKSIISIKNHDYLCLARAVFVGYRKSILKESVKRWIYNAKNVKLTRTAVNLHKRLRLPLDVACSVADVPQFESHFNVRICVLSSQAGNKLIYKGDERYAKNGTIYLYHCMGVNNSMPHYDLINSMQGFTCSNYWCDLCLKGPRLFLPTRHFCLLQTVSGYFQFYCML